MMRTPGIIAGYQETAKLLEDLTTLDKDFDKNERVITGLILAHGIKVAFRLGYDVSAGLYFVLHPEADRRLEQIYTRMINSPPRGEGLDYWLTQIKIEPS